MTRDLSTLSGDVLCVSTISTKVILGKGWRGGGEKLYSVPLGLFCVDRWAGMYSMYRHNDETRLVDVSPECARCIARSERSRTERMSDQDMCGRHSESRVKGDRDRDREWDIRRGGGAFQWDTTDNDANMIR